MLQQRLTRNLYTGQTEPLTAPLSFDFTEDLGNKRNLSLLSQYGGAAAAYSLRSLGSYNENVVRVRRASDNDEKDFTALQVSSGELTRWVNSQIVLPLDIGVETSEGRIPVPEGGTSIGTPAAAYSLRNLSTTYTGNVVEVRRSSDSTTQSFTASQIDGGEMLNFVNGGTTHLYNSARYFNGANTQVDLNSVVTMTGDFSIYLDFTYSPTAASQTYISDNTSNNRFGYSQGSSKFFISINGLTVLFDASVGISEQNSAVVTRIGADVTITVNGNSDTQTVNSDNLTIGTIGRQSGVNFVKGSIFSLNLNNQVAYTGLGTSVTAWQDTIGSNNGTETNGAAYTGQPFNGFVSTWYDQSGNANHATQGTDARQPKIVNAGALVTGGLDFDGVDDYFDAIGASSAGGSADTSIIVAKADSLTTMQILDQVGVALGIDAHSIYLDGSSGQFSLYAGVPTDISYGTATTDTTLHFVSKSNVSSSSIGYINGVGNSLNSGTAGFTGGLRIAKTRSTGSFYWNGTISEIIVYHSDQSANRTAIEANIGETYGITGIPAYDNTVDGFVETWYDQSGNGNDATQATIARQPKIVDGGVFLGEVDFLDGVNTFLVTTNSDLCNVDELSVFSVLKPFLAPSSLAVAFSCGSVVFNSPSYGGWRLNLNGSIDKAELQTQAIGSGSISIVSNSVGAGDTLVSYVADFPDASIFTNGQAGTTNTNNISPNNNDSARRRFRIGCQFTFTESGFYPKPIKEIILYTSDQSANRIAIEANINDHYNIY